MDNTKPAATWVQVKEKYKAEHNKCELVVHPTKYNVDNTLKSWTYSVTKRAPSFTAWLFDPSIPYDDKLTEGENNNRRLRAVDEPGGHSVHTNHADSQEEAQLKAEAFAENWADAADES